MCPLRLWVRLRVLIAATALVYPAHSCPKQYDDSRPSRGQSPSPSHLWVPYSTYVERAPRSIREKIANATMTGLETAEIGAYAGGSIRSLIQLLETGYISSSVTGSGHFWLYPIRERVKSHPRVRGHPQLLEDNVFPPDHRAYRWAEQYAMVYGDREALLRVLEVGHSVRLFQWADHVLREGSMPEELPRPLQHLDVNEANFGVSRVLSRRNREGIVIGIHKKLLDDYDLRPSPIPGDDGVYIADPKGLNSKYVVGLEGIEQVDHDFLDLVKRSLE